MQMMGKAPTENSKGVRLVNLPQVRDIQNEEFEKMLAGQQTAQQALDNAVDARQRGDQPGARQLIGAAPGSTERLALPGGRAQAGVASRRSRSRTLRPRSAAPCSARELPHWRGPDA